MASKRHIYADFIHRVAKPARYLGGEYQSVFKDREAVAARVVLAFPDVYEIGMSHMGTKILYSLLNKNSQISCERSFAPWTDMEKELRDRNLPLVSLESQTPLSEFDVIGISLQYELTFSNVLTILDLGGVPIHAAERANDAPLVIGGGPVATHPEPMAPFFDAFFVGEAENDLEALSLAWSAMRRNGRDRHDALCEISRDFPVYVPSLYSQVVCGDTGMHVVGEPLDPRVPPRVRRGFVPDINEYPFPSDSPVPYAEAVFDRAGIEIARGCTEGCRFCQAGMIYRPVRERSPESIVESVVKGVEKAGYDETSLTSLSTADYSCITPLVREVSKRLADKKVSLSVSSLRAYGLGDEILDEMASSRITGLTFAPEAGSQRMRDVVNKNVTEKHIEESAERVFVRGWNRLKLYFMIGLPTETDEDVREIVETGERMQAVGRRHVGKRAEVTVSVSSHVPKPHTPFQWAAQDAIGEIARKQKLLRGSVTQKNIKLKYHNRGVSFLEGIFARGDRRISALIEEGWKRGARFDGWDEGFSLSLWNDTIADLEIDTDAYLGTRPISARLPWDHIDVGLEDGFLLSEYRKALSDRLSPPCGKVRGELVHHANLEDANADQRKLVCYDCGVACDLSNMRSERLIYLDSLGAKSPTPAQTPVVRQPRHKETGKRRPTPQVAFAEKPSRRFRIRYTKLDRSAFLGHLDTSRVLARLFRRAEIELAYTRGFNPKPSMEYSPALSLGVASFGELVDVSVESDVTPDSLRERLEQYTPPGITITDVWEILAPCKATHLGRLIESFDLLINPVVAGEPSVARLARLVERFMAYEVVEVLRKDKLIDVRPLVTNLEILDQKVAGSYAEAAGWTIEGSLLVARVAISPRGSAKPIEVAEAIGVGGTVLRRPDLARLGFSGKAALYNPSVRMDVVAAPTIRGDSALVQLGQRTS